MKAVVPNHPRICNSFSHGHCIEGAALAAIIKRPAFLLGDICRQMNIFLYIELWMFLFTTHHDIFLVVPAFPSRCGGAVGHIK